MAVQGPRSFRTANNAGFKPSYNPGQTNVPYNQNHLNLIKVKQQVLSGHAALTRELASKAAETNYFNKADKITAFGALNTIPTNHNPSGRGVPGDLYPGFTTTDYQFNQSTRLPTRVTHNRGNMQFASPQNCFDGSPGDYDMTHGRDLPQIEVMRKDALMKGSIANRQAGQQILERSLNESKRLQQQPGSVDINPFLPKPGRSQSFAPHLGRGIKRRRINRYNHIDEEDDSNSDDYLDPADNNAYFAETNNSNYV